MFNVELGRNRTCDGVTRRDMLKVGALGGLSLPALLQLQDQAQAEGFRVGNGQKAENNGKKLNVILMWMQGGASHIDSFDPKPDAPDSVRGEFKTIPTVHPGIYLSEKLPRLAKNMDKFSLIRSGYSYTNGHGVADAYWLSGWKYNRNVVYPTFGSVVAKELGYDGVMPPYVQLGKNINRSHNAGIAGYLGNQYNPLEIGEDPNRSNFSVDGISLPNGISSKRFDRRQRMLAKLDAWQQANEKASDGVQAMDSFYEKAFGMVTSPEAKKAFDLSKEDPRLRDEYGRNKFGQSLLLARRLIQSGVRFLTVTSGGWDTHQKNFTSLSRRLPELDQGYAALLRDLAHHGMLDNTLVIWMGDFGRTPKINTSAGRDHWKGSCSICIGGGGIRTGEVIGRSDELGREPITNPIRGEDIGTTLYSLLGIDIDKHYTTTDGRPMVLMRGGRVLSELLA